MASITIRNLPDATKQRLRIRAAERGHSMEEEARSLIERGLFLAPKPSNGKNWVEDMILRMQAIGDAEFEMPEGEPLGEPLNFSGPEFDP